MEPDPDNLGGGPSHDYIYWFLCKKSSQSEQYLFLVACVDRQTNKQTNRRDALPSLPPGEGKNKGMSLKHPTGHSPRLSLIIYHINLLCRLEEPE